MNNREENINFLINKVAMIGLFLLILYAISASNLNEDSLIRWGGLKI